MVETRKYANPPITEAVVDIKVAGKAGVTLASMDPAFAAWKAIYPKQEPIYAFEAAASFNVGKDGPHSRADSRHAHVGEKFTSADGKYVLQARPNSFTLSRLHPYERWENLRDEARKLWQNYARYVQPDHATRVAVRYINKILLPVERAELSEYFHTYPSIANSPGEPMERYFVQMVSMYPSLGFKSIINQAGSMDDGGTSVSVILDIDLYKEAKVSAAEADLWEVLEGLHAKENKIFEACITDKTRELFK